MVQCLHDCNFLAYVHRKFIKLNACLVKNLNCILSPCFLMLCELHFSVSTLTKSRRDDVLWAIKFNQRPPDRIWYADSRDFPSSDKCKGHRYARRDAEKQQHTGPTREPITKLGYKSSQANIPGIVRERRMSISVGAEVRKYGNVNDAARATSRARVQMHAVMKRVWASNEFQELLTAAIWCNWLV